MNKQAVIFDFDGTIAESIESTIRIYNVFASEHGYKKIENIDKVRGKGPNELSGVLGIPMRRAPFVMKEMRMRMKEEFENVQPIDGMKEVLQELKDSDRTIGIVSSNSEENIKAFCLKHQIPMSDYVYSGSSIFGKARLIKKLMKEMNADEKHTVYIGDETRDVAAAKKCGIGSIGVTWGFASEKALTEERPDYIAKKSADILAYLKTIHGDN